MKERLREIIEKAFARCTEFFKYLSEKLRCANNGPEEKDRRFSIRHVLTKEKLRKFFENASTQCTEFFKNFPEKPRRAYDRFVEKYPHFPMWGLLVVALIFFVAISFFEGINFNISLKSGSFKQQLSGVKEEKGPTFEELMAADTINPKDIQAADTTVKHILIFGDSQTNLLASRIADYGVENGYTVTSVTWDGSSSIGWSTSDKFNEGWSKGKPDFIFVSLGGNESKVGDKAARAKYIMRVVERFKGVPYVWIGPSFQPDDRQFDVMMLETLPRGNYFITDFDLELGPDNIHPTRKGATVLVDSLMRWMPKSTHPIPSVRPNDTIRNSKYERIYYRADGTRGDEPKKESEKPKQEVKEQKEKPKEESKPEAPTAPVAPAAPATPSAPAAPAEQHNDE